RDRTLLDLSRTCEDTADRRSRDALQRALSLGRSAGTRNGSGTRDRPLSHPHALLLARRRRRVPQREHHGRRARNRKGKRARAQTRDRRASRVDRDAGLVHERVLGRTQRDQAERDLADCVSGVAVIPSVSEGAGARVAARSSCNAAPPAQVPRYARDDISESTVRSRSRRSRGLWRTGWKACPTPGGRYRTVSPIVIAPIARPPSITGTEICARLRDALSS